MVVPFKKKNTIEKNGFKLTDTGFWYSGNHYGFNEVISLARFRQVHETKVLFVGSDYTHQVSIAIQTKSGEHLQVTEQESWTGSSRENIVEYIDNAYSVIAERSWNSRCQNYLTSLEQYGYYAYGGFRFYPKTKSIVEISTGKEYKKDEISVSRSATAFYGKRKNHSNLLKKIWTGSDDEIIISTLYDNDVFYTLLKHYFGISWNSANNQSNNGVSELPKAEPTPKVESAPPPKYLLPFTLKDKPSIKINPSLYGDFDEPKLIAGIIKSSATYIIMHIKSDIAFEWIKPQDIKHSIEFDDEFAIAKGLGEAIHNCVWKLMLANTAIDSREYLPFGSNYTKYLLELFGDCDEEALTNGIQIYLESLIDYYLFKVQSI